MHKKLVIAKQKLQIDSVLEADTDYTVIAVFEDDVLTDISCYPEGHESILGNIYVGRVQNVVKNLNAAFIDISPKQTGYYSMENYNAPIFVKRIGKKPLCIGDEILVQIQKEAIKTKDPVVTTNLSFPGKYAVLTTENCKLGVSTKLDKDKRNHFKELLETKKSDEYGLIVRTSAKDASDEELLAEIERLENTYKQIRDTAIHKTCYSCVYQEKGQVLKAIEDINLNDLEEIVIEDETLYKEVTEYISNLDEDKLSLLRLYQDMNYTLAKLYNIEKNLERALSERVWLKSGAYLIIQPTEALTVIDVNSGKNVGRKNVQENFLKINIESAKEIARQLRLRNISGICIVDFINLESKEAEEELLRVFRTELKKDPVPTRLMDITKLGLVELTRKKVKKSLKEQINCSKVIDEQ